MSHANGFSPFRGKVNRFIIPIVHFKGTEYKKQIQQETVIAESNVDYKPKEIDQSQNRIEEKPTPTPKIKIENSNLAKGVPSLSISSIQLKREAERKSSKKNEINDAQDDFSKETLSELWKTYTRKKNNQGENNIAALMEMSQPELLEDYKILLKTTSALSKVELTKELTPLLTYLNKSLNNYKITFEVKVEAQKSEEYVYGVREKYDYLKKINPEIETLKKEFDLDL